jgi:hypothetical protein
MRKKRKWVYGKEFLLLNWFKVVERKDE